MILSKQELQFYIAADRIMNGLPPRRSLKEFVLSIINPCVRGVGIIKYLRALRKCAYYRNTMRSVVSVRAIKMVWWHCRFDRLSLKLGFTIGPNSLGYGTVIPHFGTIVINGDARIGNYAVLHTSTCVAGGDKEIGDFFYLSAGSQLVGRLSIGDGVSVAAHSLVNHSCEGHCLLAGAPAEVKKTDYPLWVERDGETFLKRVESVEKLKNKMIK